MKTSVAYQSPYNSAVALRATLPGENAEGKGHVARFSEAHVETYHTLGGQTSHTRKLPNSVMVGGTRHPLPTDAVRVIPASYVEELHALDEQIAALERERRDLVAEAFRRGRKIKKADLVVEPQEVKP